MHPIIHHIIVEKASSFLQDPYQIAAIVVSIAALFVSIGGLLLQRTHNKKTVRPAGHIQLSDSVQELSVRIVNKGCGPMYIKEFIADRMGVINHNLVNHLSHNFNNGFPNSFHTAPEGYWLLPGEELILIQLEGDPFNINYVSVRENVRSILSKIQVHLTYHDVYDKKHPVYTKSLEWFGRDLQ